MSVETPEYVIILPSILDIGRDDDGVLRMPFNPADYGKDNSIKRKCCICVQEFLQGEMKELSTDDDNEENAYHDHKKVYGHSIFYCRKCWFSNPISDASRWVA